MYGHMTDKFSIKGKNNDLRIEISEHLKDVQSITLFVNHLQLNGHYPIFDPNTHFRINFALRREEFQVRKPYLAIRSRERID